MDGSFNEKHIGRLGKGADQKEETPKGAGQFYLLCEVVRRLGLEPSTLALKELLRQLLLKMID